VRRQFSIFALMAAAGIIIPAAAGIPVANAIVVPPSFGTRLVDVPVSEAHNPRAFESIIDDLTPGTVIRRRILIQNKEPQTSHFTVYPDAARIRNGSFEGDPGQTRSELTTWISIQNGRVTLSPDKTVMDLVTIRVPRVATRGEHYGVIWVQQSARAKASGGVAVTEVNRIGIPIYLAVSHGALPTKFVITAVAGHRSPHGQPILTVRISDTGGRAVDLSGTARLTDGPGGTSAGPFSSRAVLTLAPGQSGTLTFLAGDRLPDGPWTATVRVVSGLNVVSGSATIDFSGHVPGRAWYRTSAAVLGGGGGIAVLLMFAIGWRRRGLLGRREPARAWHRGPAGARHRSSARTPPRRA
jgi:hypothetical protein